MDNGLKICMCGLGRTGKEIASTIINEPDMNLVMAICSNQNQHLGEDLCTVLSTSPTGIYLESSDFLERSIAEHLPDVAIDFSTPDAVMSNAEIFAKNHVNLVIGTTGFTDIQLHRLHNLAEQYRVGIVYAPNITLGVNVMMTLVNLAATLLEEYDCTITETHFKNKKDAPSGTANKIAIQARKGIEARGNNNQVEEIPIHSLRTGGVIGQHSVILAGEYDKVEITHESFSRKAFAIGALKAVRFVSDKAGFFEMQDVLDLERVIANYVRQNAPKRYVSKAKKYLPGNDMEIV